MARRVALLVATDTYRDRAFSGLEAPGADARALAAVLREPAIGGYDVEVLRNAEARDVTQAIERVCTDADLDDLVLLYISGHGIKNDVGQLYFAATDTRQRLLASTGVSAQFVRDQITRCHSRRVVVLLDCCFGGAFPPDSVHRAGERVDVVEQLGKGCAVMTASSALEYAFEFDAERMRMLGTGKRSLFTSVVVQGLESGDADLVGDGHVDINELYDYVRQEVRLITPKQTPTLHCELEGELIIATSPRGPRHAAAQEAVVPVFDGQEPVRVAKVRIWAELARSADPGVAENARGVLAGLARHPDAVVRQMAADALTEEKPKPGFFARRLRNRPDGLEHVLQQQAEQMEAGEAFAGLIINLLRRTADLSQRQLQLLDTLEQEEEDPDRLAELFRIDHLTTRIRRHVENVLLLSGTELSRDVKEPVPVAEILGAAVSEVEQYQRVTISPVPKAAVWGRAVNDLVHLLAELIDNATGFSPPETQVEVRAFLGSRGRLVIEIRDDGVGMSAGEAAEINRQLAVPGPVPTRRVGMVVVGRLARRHDIRVRIQPAGDTMGGVLAVVTAPAQLVRS